MLILVFIVFTARLETMGNCLKAQNNDDISLLRGNDSHDGVEQALGPPPPYQACFVCFGFTSPSSCYYFHFNTWCCLIIGCFFTSPQSAVSVFIGGTLIRRFFDS